MIRLPRFRYVAPESASEVARILNGEGPSAMLVAGGTDVYPNMKRGQHRPSLLVGLHRVAELRQGGSTAGRDGSERVLGAGTRLEDLVEDEGLARRHFALWSAASQVATPLIRNQATLGGNLCLDTRCNYYNQSREWRASIAFCMKAPAEDAGRYDPAAHMNHAIGSPEVRVADSARGAGRTDGRTESDGSICWVAPGSPRCWAVSSSDTAPALIALDAEVVLVGPDGDRRIPVESLYRDDGMAYLAKRPDEVVTAVHVPSRETRRSTYWKLRRRGAFDFPVLGVAVSVDMAASGEVTGARIALGAVASRPVDCSEAAALLVGSPLTDRIIEDCAAAVSRNAKPLDNTDHLLGWRKQVTPRFVAGALRELRGDPFDAGADDLVTRRARKRPRFESRA